MNILQIYSNKVTITAERNASNVTLYDVDLDEIIPQFNVEDLLDAIVNHTDLGRISDYVAKKMEEE